MKMRQLWIAGCLLIVSGLASGCGTKDVPESGTPIASDLALTTFDRAWETIRDTHFDTTFNGVDWQALRVELRPQAEAATTVEALRNVLRVMVGRLEQSHFALLPAEIVDALDPTVGEELDRVGDVGFEVRVIDEHAVVTKVAEGSPAAALGIRPGWVITAIGEDGIAGIVEAVRAANSRYAEGYMIWESMQRRLQGPPEAVRAIGFLDDSDRPLELEVTLGPEPGQAVKFGNLPTVFARFDSYRAPLLEEGLQVGVIWFNFWMVPLVRQIDRAVEEFRDLDGIVIDLRGNRGGVGAMVSGVAGHFLTEAVSLGTFRTRETVLEIRANPRRVNPAGQRVEPYSGPLAILVDEVTGSASEMFAGGMQAIGRARVFGVTSVGAVLPAVMDRLPNQDVLYHAIADFTTGDGVMLEGRGVIPDEEVPLRREDLLAGRDAPLQAAVRWIRAQQSTASGDVKH